MGELFTPTHLLFVGVIFFLLFGAKKLPELGKGLGEGMRGFKEGIKGGPDTPAPAPQQPVQQAAVAAQPVATTAPVEPK